MRLFFTFSIIVFLLAGNADAQTETAAQAFENGVAGARAGQYEKALRDFHNALEKQRISNNSSDTFAAKINYNIGVCFYHLHRPHEAIFHLTKAVELGKNNARDVFYALAMAHVELEDWTAAKTAFRRAIHLQRKRDGESRFDLGMVYLREKDFKNAADAFQKAIRYKSIDAATARNNLGVISAINGDWLAARKQFETALAMSGGKLPEAKRNLEFCRFQNFNRDSVAKLEFLNKKNKEN